MKTGTPPRLDGRSINYSVLEEQPGDEKRGRFSYLDFPLPEKQLSCWITYTNNEVHEILKEGFDKSPMFTGRIQGIGPRYCPSIEDKINRFADKERHQLFIEPEGWNTVEIYLNGFSTSLPESVQYKALRSITGFENVKMFRPGYAIEYDFFPPQQLNLTLETKAISNLYFAGQINGTTGYEEAACQGLVAGINAHRKLKEESEFILKRSEAYIGVLIDDLVTKGTDEPYRMFTSRAEFRTVLRQDNADLRLTAKSHEMGLASAERLSKVEAKQTSCDSLIEFIRCSSVSPDQINPFLIHHETEEIRQKGKLFPILLRPQVKLVDLIEFLPSLNDFAKKLPENNETLFEQAEITIKYEGYIEKESDLMNRFGKMEAIHLKDNFDYLALNSLSMEARLKLSKIRPSTLGQASRISGISPADISVLMVHISR